ncbi:class I SAM-dependent methyltransferase [Saccharothrix sp.]|uniref:class I SAM-dependent methyltransferase n=1 Tax=Saccharothrix sp. TaxID=1873460 RepID=UPI002811A37A|nr:class I SAM-dependent methyltransferase [Saccharothrix sp.]
MTADGTTTPFDAIAAAYDEDDFHQVIAERLVTDIPTTGGLVVDVATGTGHAAFAALQHLRPQRIVAVDLSPAMIASAAAKAESLDPSGVIDWRVADAVPAPVADGTADVVLCASSLHFLGMAAFTDWLRILRPGGVLAYSLPSPETFNPSPTFAALIPRDLALPPTPSAAIHLTEAAGFTQASATELKTTTDRPRSVFLVHAKAPGR